MVEPSLLEKKGSMNNDESLKILFKIKYNIIFKTLDQIKIIIINYEN